MKNIECILLIDDSPSTNFYNKKIIEKANIKADVHEAFNGLDALNFLKKQNDFTEHEVLKPNIIFLDINMPKMDGFEFLQEYSKLTKENRSKAIVVFLTTSTWSKDKIKAVENDLVYGFIEKPLSNKELEKVIIHYNQLED
ncbi:response regulator [uncultured Nonlabens sp.]|uniref:response regulator n=1 Tax=uncultured Nonlabens sp. TaxID=859306 RepID=UPI0026129A9E|nr:response regulator [uncultured Nonlabens sp.]